MTFSTKKRVRPSIYQVLLLDNDASLDVEIQEAQQVDFSQVKEHLKHGGSVFITSKNSQKLQFPKSNAQQNYARSRKSIGFLYHKQIRSL